MNNSENTRIKKSGDYEVLPWWLKGSVGILKTIAQTLQKGVPCACTWHFTTGSPRSPPGEHGCVKTSDHGDAFASTDRPAEKSIHGRAPKERNAFNINTAWQFKASAPAAGNKWLAAVKVKPFTCHTVVRHASMWAWRVCVFFKAGSNSDWLGDLILLQSGVLELLFRGEVYNQKQSQTQYLKCRFIDLQYIYRHYSLSLRTFRWN